ncbi:hypothetical protein BD414DRAFT_427832 [Trametes punicea]|nr:hypothetical protein BD414DRAFT_427832 [Trametes punicea]
MSDLVRVLEAQGDTFAALPGVPALDNTFGVILVCTFLGCMLFGLTSHQTYRYFRLYLSDPLGMKAFVRLDIGHSVIAMHICYFYLVTNYFNPIRLLYGVWWVPSDVGCVIVVSHVFYSRRVWRRAYMPPPAGVLSAQLTASGSCAAVTSTVEAFVQPSFQAYQHYNWVTCSTLAVAVVLDLFIAGLLIFYLRRSRTGFKRTDSLVDVLMVYTINTGDFLYSIISLIASITAITMPGNLIYSGVYIIAAKMYANSLLAVLNSRRSLIDRGLEGFETGSLGLQVVTARHRKGGPLGLASPTSPKIPTVIDVKVTTEVFCDDDVDGRGSVAGRSVEWNEVSSVDKGANAGVGGLPVPTANVILASECAA